MLYMHEYLNTKSNNKQIYIKISLNLTDVFSLTYNKSEEDNDMYFKLILCNLKIDNFPIFNDLVTLNLLANFEYEF